MGSSRSGCTETAPYSNDGAICAETVPPVFVLSRDSVDNVSG